MIIENMVSDPPKYNTGVKLYAKMQAAEAQD